MRSFEHPQRLSRCARSWCSPSSAALALPSAGPRPPGVAAASDPDAPDGVAQAPGDSLRGKALGGATSVSRETLERAAEQAKAIPSAGGSWEYAGANNIGGRVTDVVVDPDAGQHHLSSPPRAAESGRAPTRA